MKNSIKEIIKEKGCDLDMVFVFPTRIVSQLWFKKSLEITGLETTIAENYISWDMFKTQCLNSEIENLTSVSNTIRNIFANYLCQENAKSKNEGGRFFSSIINEENAENSTVFSDWIASVLPQLDHLEKRYKKKLKQFSNDEEFSDYLLLKEKYSQFLQENSLYEPSWNQSRFNSFEKKYIIIYPELLEDFSEYAEILEKQNSIFYFNISEFKKEDINLDLYKNSRIELKTVVLQIEKMLSEGTPANEIAVSVPDIENYTPYIKREFELKNIPVEFRSGFNLANTQIGKLFSLIVDCVEKNFSFETMKAIILNNHIPWKDLSGAMALIDYGVKNNCKVSWKEKPNDNDYKNIWIESFKINYEQDQEQNFYKEQAKNWFNNFYTSVIAMYKSKSFLELQKNYFAFKTKCIDADAFNFFDNALLGRCLSILDGLLYLEEKFSKYLPQNRFKFFILELEKEIYVSQNTGRAVSVFPYKVVAGAPFKAHFILNCSQRHTNIVYDKLSFLRKDKKEDLGVFEIDATTSFFSAYTNNGNCIFSFADHYIDKQLVINNNFETTEELKIKAINNTEKKQKELSAIDSFLSDYNLIKSKQIYKIQKTGFENFLKLKKQNSFSYLKNSYDNCNNELNTIISEEKMQDGAIKTSQSDLKEFYSCPASWFLTKALNVCVEKYDAKIFDARNIGNLGHKILEILYTKIKSQDKVFLSKNIEKYKKIARKEFDELAKMNSEFKGGLAKPFIQSLKDRVMQAVDFVLQVDAENLDSYEPRWIEKWIELENNGVLYRGKIDRVSFPQDEGSPVIIDYKTNSMPTYSSSGKKDDPAENIELTDFQIPFYIFLTETNSIRENKKTSEEYEKIEEAWFVSFVQQKVNKVITSNAKRSEKTREQFDATMEVFIQYAEQFADCVRSKNFTPELDEELCFGCQFRHICRTTYSMKTSD